MPLALFLCFFERPIALMSLSFLGAMVLCGGAGRGDGAEVVRAKSRGERVAASQERQGYTWVFTDQIV